jgi:hypothetical protein
MIDVHTSSQAIEIIGSTDSAQSILSFKHAIVVLRGKPILPQIPSSVFFWACKTA